MFPADEPPALVISTDRPSFSNGTGIQPQGHLNFEMGYLYTVRNRDEVNQQRNTLPELLVRLGVLEDRLEFRVSTSGYAWIHTDPGPSGRAEDTEGWNDFALGMKLKLWDQDVWLPRVAVLGQCSTGSGSDSVSSEIAEPAAQILWSYDLSLCLNDALKGWTLGGNVNAAWPTSNGERFLQGQFSAYLSFPIAGTLSGFAEFYALTPNTKGSSAACYVDTGVLYLIDPRVQLDARIGFGLTDQSDSFYVGIGPSVLF